jgi:hypothetical protein
MLQPGDQQLQERITAQTSEIQGLVVLVSAPVDVWPAPVVGLMIAFTPLLPTNFDIGSAVDRARRLPRTRGLAMCYDDAFECTRQHSDGGTRR